MGRFTTFVGALALVVTACGGTASPAVTPVPATATPAAATPVPATATPAWATPVPETVIAVKATFDGKTCTYSGPAVVPAGSMLDWTLENTPAALEGSTGAALVVVPVVDGTTWEQVLADVTNAKATDVPAWAVIPGAGSDGLAEVKILYSEAAELDHHLFTKMTRNAYYIGCHTAPEQTNKPYPAILLKVLKG